MTDPQRRVLLGHVASAHGIRGEVLIKSYTDVPEDIAAYGPLSDEEGRRQLEIRVVRVTQKGVIARVKGIEDRNAAEALKGIKLHVAREHLPAATEDEFYHSDLIGLTVVDPAGTMLGEVLAIQNYGAGDLLEIRLESTAQSELVPFTRVFVPEIDLVARKIVVLMPVSAEGEEP